MTQTRSHFQQATPLSLAVATLATLSRPLTAFISEIVAAESEMAKPVTARQAGRQSSGSDGPEPVRVLTHGGLFLTQNDGPAPSASLTRLNQGHPLMPWNVCWHGPESVTVRLHVRNNATTLCSCHIPACSCTSHAAYLRNEHELRQSASPILALCLQCFPQCWCPRLLGPTASPPASLTTRPAGDGRPARPE